jgi:hypothetical protein
MRKIVLSAFALFLALPAYAIQRYDSDNLSCAQVKGIIYGDGAAIIRYRSTFNPRLQLYERYVRNDLFCEYEERTKTVFIPTADTRNCAVYKCEKVDPDDFPIIIPD